MTTLESITQKKFPVSLYLILGAALIGLSHVTYGVDYLGWFASVPFLLYLSKTNGFKSRLLFFLAFFLGWSLAIYKIISDPIPAVLLVLYSLPISIMQFSGYIIWARTKKYRMVLFPLMMVILEWIQYTYTPFASWGAAAYTQLDSPIIAQSVSLFGIAGLSFIIYFMNAGITEVILTKKINRIVAPALVLTVLLLWGSFRLDNSRAVGTETITIAAIGTDSDIGGLPLPEAEKNLSVIAGVFNRTRIAASQGAELIVWNEAAFYILKEDEDSLIKSVQDLALEVNSTIVVAYVVPTQEEEFKYENKYLFVTNTGHIDHSYLKHEPVPGEPAIKGTSEQKVVAQKGVNIGGAICYDYDFPHVAGENKKAGSDVVALPSSDWRGIDPIHTQMAAFRAIEQGYSVVRSTRFGLSAAITPYGVMKAQMSSFDDNDKILVTDLPSQSVTTLYSIIGDLFIWLCIGLLIILCYLEYKTRKPAENL